LGAGGQIGGFMKRNKKCVWMMLFITSFIVALTACAKPSEDHVKDLISKRLTFEWPGVQIESIGPIEYGEKSGGAWAVRTKVRYVRSKKKHDETLLFNIKKDDSGVWLAEFTAYARGF
jgi:hypothetical protein